MAETKVYLDMDGVLANFYVEYAKIARSIPNAEPSTYKHLPSAKTDPVLKVIQNSDFFSRLPKYDSADQLIRLIIKSFGKYSICSSPLRGDHEGSEQHKRIWIKKHLNPQPREIIITPNKAKYAVQEDGTPNILIDDKQSNISAWNAAGGIGILYLADEDSLSVVADGITSAKEKMRSQRSSQFDSDIMKKPFESASAGATSAGSVASSSATGGGWLFGGSVGAPKVNKRKSKVLKR